MSIIDVTGLTLPTPEALEAKQARVHVIGGGIVNEMVKGNAIACATLFNLLWHNEQGLTPQQVLDSFGADAASLVGILTAVGVAMSSVIPGGLGLANPHSLTPNEDGTVTVGT